MSLFTLISVRPISSPSSRHRLIASFARGQGGVSVSQAFGGGLSWVYAMAVCWWISVVVAIGVAIGG